MKPDNIGFAILMVLIGIGLVAAADLVSKSIIPLLSIWQLLVVRSCFGLTFLLCIIFYLKKLPSINPISFSAVIVRSLLMTACYICFFLGLAKIPIALVAGAFFCGPFFMVLLSRVMLGEKFGLWRTISLIGGFIGVLLVLQPNSAEYDPFLLLSLLSAFLYALTQVVTRKYCKKEDPTALSFWLTITFLITGVIGMVVLWGVNPLVGEQFINRPGALLAWIPILIISFLGISNVIVHYTLSAAYQNAPSSLIAPLEYIYLPIAALGGYFFYDEIPNFMAMVGIAIIIIAGLIVAWRKDA